MDILQVRSGSASISSGTPDKSQLSRTELYTKDVIDYLHNLLDEILSKNTNCTSISQGRDRSPQVIYEGEERSLHFKWWYMVRIVHWHHSEGLLLPSHIIEWVLNQMQVLLFILLFSSPFFIDNEKILSPFLG